MKTVTGIVKYVNDKGRAAGSNFVLEDGTRIGVYDPKDMAGISPGDNITCNVVEKGSYLNLKGKPTGGSSGGGTTTASSSPPPSGLPISRDLSIIRQNALGHAVDVLGEFVTGLGIEREEDHTKALMEYVDRVIMVARVFESYSSGKLDEVLRKKAAESMSAPE